MGPWLAGAVTVWLVASAVTAMVLVDAGVDPPPVAQTSPPLPGRDPVLAQQLAEQADALGRRDPAAELRLRLAAHVLDVDGVAHRVALAQLLLGPRPLSSATATPRRSHRRT